MIRALILCALLSACGGGGSSAPPVSVPDAPVILFRQSGAPVLVTSPAGPGAFPRDRGFIATFGLGQQGFTWDELGVGIVNDSWAAPSGSDSIKTVNYSWMPSASIRPWSDGSNSQVCTSFAASVPGSSISGGHGNYAGAGLWFVDASTGKHTSGREIIVEGFYFVDAQGNGPLQAYGPKDYLAPLNALQFAAPLGNNQWFTTTAGALTRTPWAEPKRMGFCISRDQMLFLLVASVGLFGGMADVHDIELRMGLISSETALPGPSSQDRNKPGARLETVFRDWTVSIQGVR